MRNFKLVLMVILAACLQSAFAEPQKSAGSGMLGKDLPFIPGHAERGRDVANELGIMVGKTTNPHLVNGGFLNFGNQWGPNHGVYSRGGLTFRQRELVVISAIASAGMPQGIGWHYSQVARVAGITERELEELHYTTCYFAGYPRCSAALEVFFAVMNGENKWPKEQRGLAPIPELGPQNPNSRLLAKDTPPSPALVQRGRALGAELGTATLEELYPELKGSGFVEFTNTFGPTQGVYGRGGLPFKEREMVAISSIVASGNTSALEWHIKEVALRAGLTEREIQEIILTNCFYAGWPRCTPAMVEFRRIMNGPNKWPKERRGLAPLP
jgi:alkylhydroperoxidase/carboxymuconolactone decarboxylase family protein YurZ